MAHSSAHVVGLISDTHGLLRPGVYDAFQGVELILHAGDVGGADILEELSLIAPVKAVFGNTDPTDTPQLTQALELTIDRVTIHLSHGHELGSPTPAKLAERYAADVVVYGHTHRQLVTRLEGRLIVNPGAAGPKRFNLTPTVARLTIAGETREVELVDIP